MFARFGHARFNVFRFNENDHDADAVGGKDFAAVGSTAKSMTALTSGAKTFGALSENAGKPFVEVGG